MTKSPLNSFTFTWGSQQSHILDGLKSLAVGEISNVFLTDVTLACEGEYIEAHRLVLSLCSSFFKDLFNQNEKISDKANGIVILGHVAARDLRYILQFMYQGSVQIPKEHVDSFLEAGEMLKVEGLVGVTGVGIGLADKTPRVGGPSSTSTPAAAPRPCPRSKKPSNVNPITSTSIKRRRTSGPGGSDDESGAVKKDSQPNPTNVKSEPCLRIVTAFDDDNAADQLDAGELMDDFVDGGGDSDFGGGDVSGDDELTATFNPEPSTSTSKVEIKKTVVTPKREGGTSTVGSGGRARTNDSSSSDDDDGDSSDGSGSTEDYFDSPPASRPRRPIIPKRRLNWELVQKFATIEEAKAHVKAQKKWTLRYCRTLVSEGKKYTYDCYHSRACPAKIYLTEGETSADLYSTGEEHTCTAKVKKQGLSEEVKARINALWANGVRRPQRIMWALKKEGIEPKVTQVVAFVQYNIRRKFNGSSN